MNRYPAWLNLLVLGILVLGCTLALPNLYGTTPAQLGGGEGQGPGEQLIEHNSE